MFSSARSVAVSFSLCLYTWFFVFTSQMLFLCRHFIFAVFVAISSLWLLCQVVRVITFMFPSFFSASLSSFQISMFRFHWFYVAITFPFSLAHYFCFTRSLQLFLCCHFFANLIWSQVLVSNALLLSWNLGFLLMVAISLPVHRCVSLLLFQGLYLSAHFVAIIYGFPTKIENM